MIIGSLHRDKDIQLLLNYPIGQLNDFMFPPHCRQVPSIDAWMTLLIVVEVEYLLFQALVRDYA